MIEAAELLECFQWADDADPERVKEERADVATYCHLLAARLGVDLDQVVLDKPDVTGAKYPLTKARGTCEKYDRLPD